MLILLKTLSLKSSVEGTRNKISIFKLFLGIVCQRGLVMVAQHLAVYSSDTLAGREI